MNDHTLDRNEMNGEDLKKNDMDSIIIEHKKIFHPQVSLPLSESHLGTTESFRHDNLGMARNSSDDLDRTMTNWSQPNKPSMRFETSLSVSMNQIKDMFMRVCRKRGFNVIDEERDQITAMCKHFLSLKEVCVNCFKGKYVGWQSVTSIRLTSKTNKVTCRRKIVIKGLVGDGKLIKAFFFDFSNELDLYESRRSSAFPHKTTGSSFFSEQGLSQSINHIKTSRYVPIVEESHSDEEELSISPQNLESYSFYEFRKILSSDQYAIGKKVAEFLRDYFASFSNLEESVQLLPQPMEKLYYKINETTETFFADFNYGKSDTKKMMPYCKTSVEKYIFDQVFANLFGMYLIKYEKQSRLYKEKSELILQETNPLKHLKFLDISQKFWLISPDKLNESKELKEPLREFEIPYINAINEFAKISKVRSPREKLGVLLMMHSFMKSSVVEFHKGREEIISMDEELPIMIYVVLMCKVENIMSELIYVDDYVQLDPTLESEKRLMTNIKVSVQYISDEWRID